ncbi:AAA family ATPase [Micromonospora profundi]|uniref:AAA family ATPase n=1 Tax=Micromonospora TaxID=1873 RepID=UPI0033BE7F11
MSYNHPLTLVQEVAVQVQGINISKFRGIDSTSLEDCGNLNVLIGKNNSGKSTILNALDSFFSVVSSGSVVALNDVKKSETSSAFGRSFDFHRSENPASPIKISVSLQLNLEETQEIVAELIAEAPQMKHALDSVGVAERLKIEATSIPNEIPFAFVSQIALVGASNANTEGDQARILFSVDADSALELLARRLTGNRADYKASELLAIGGRLDSEEYQMLKREMDERGRTTRGRYLRHSVFSGSEVAFEVEDAIRRSNSYAEFRRHLEALAASAEEVARQAEVEPLKNLIGTFSGEAEIIPKYALSILGRVAQLKVLHLRDRRDPVGREEAHRLLALKTRRKGPEVLRNIQETVQSLLGVSIDAFESEHGESRAEMDVDEVLVEMNGAGIREALRLVLDNELGSPDLLLVEEPEVHLHPALEVSMLRYLKAASARTQIFVTTHSTNFLDTSDMRNVYLTRRDPWVTVSLLDYEQAEIAIPEELGIRLSSLFMYDRLVFVEGASDEAVLRELAPRAGVNFGQANVGFVVMGSSRNFTHYASRSTIEILTKRRVKMSFILDRDESSDEDIAALRARLEGIAHVHVLQRREMENYLATPRPLTEFIQEKRRLQNSEFSDVTEDLVTRRLSECADKLRQFAIEKRVLRASCRPVFFDREAIFEESSDDDFSSRVASELRRQAEALGARAAETERLLKHEEEHVNSQWQGKKMDLVPGDELLDSVCREFGVRFKKRHDGVRIAGLMRTTEVPAELAQLLRRLVA